ncbi:MAG: DedA family protein [Gemmatimonadetes bacterium]|nr:DedA family protein [Gemmatimonadota bacterium]
MLFGAFLAAAGRADPRAVFLWTWIPNIVSALLVYRLAHRYGRGFFARPAAHWLLHPRQLEAIGRFYARFGTPAIFVSRFLPGFRAMVPVFAGISHVHFWRIAPPLALASAIWYGALVYVGTVAGRNWRAILAAFERVSDVLLWIALPLLGLLLLWWWRTRRHPHE